MRFSRKRVEPEVMKPSPQFERPKFLHLDAPEPGYSLTIQIRGKDPESFYSLKNVMIGETYVTAVASDRTSFHYPYFNLEWFSVSKEGDL